MNKEDTAKQKQF